MPASTTPPQRAIAFTAYDAYYYAFDGVLSVPLGRIVAEAVVSRPWLDTTVYVVYQSLMIVLGLYVVWQRHPDGRWNGHLIGRWLLAACFGYALYHLMPGVGPRVAMANTFPNHMPDPNGVLLAPITHFGNQPRNLMPSLHMTWAMLIVLASTPMGRLARLGAWIFLVGTFIATLGLGEHYLIDLIVAVPFTVAIEGLASLWGRRRPRLTSALAFAGGLTMTLCWLLTIRYGIDFLRAARWLAALLVLGTFVLSALLHWGPHFTFLVWLRRSSREFRAGLARLSALLSSTSWIAIPLMASFPPPRLHRTTPRK